VQGDILTLPFAAGQFELVLNCSTIEHVGLAGRYGVLDEKRDGDLAAMGRLRTIMKVGGTMLMTIPVGQDAVFAPLCRVYGERRLPALLDGFTIKEEEYWVKERDNRWQTASRRTALAFRADAGSWTPLRNIYALGLFVLRRAP
jgi:hypothetical protein